MVDRDYYQLLGVSIDASDDEIHAAYRKRINIIHPDRFDAERQPQQWQVANQMVAELNAAYSALRNRESRRRHDRALRKRRRSRNAASAVVVRFRDLRPATQEKLLALQRGHSQFFKFRHGSPVIGFRFKTGTPAIAWGCFVLAAVLLSEIVRFAGATGWGSESADLIWFGALPAVLLTAGASVQLIAWYRSPIRDYAYLTPLYYIRTRRGKVVFRWLWSIRTIMVKRTEGRLGRETRSIVLLAFSDHMERLVLDSALSAHELAAALKVWEQLTVESGVQRSASAPNDPFPEIGARLRSRLAPGAFQWTNIPVRNRA